MAAALRSMGVPSNEHVPHGFRSSASTLLHEAGYDSQLIELQLAHSDVNKVRAVYNRAERLEERKELMQEWADSHSEDGQGGCRWTCSCLRPSVDVFHAEDGPTFGVVTVSHLVRFPKKHQGRRTVLLGIDLMR